MTRENAKEIAKNLVSQMTLEEKAGLLLNDSKAVERINIHEFNWWNEALHGVARNDVATVFPQAIGLASMFDPKYLKKIAQTIATEARAKYNENIKYGDRSIFKGLTFWSPNINIFRDPRWGRGQETYGEDPFLSAKLGTNFVEGLQGNGDFLKAAACAKHFAGHSGPERLRHEFDAEISKKDLFETYLPAFEELVVDSDVEGVMGAYNRTNGEPCCANSFLMDDVLFKRWNFKGYFVSDCGAICDFHDHHKVTKDGTNSAALALNHGCDINCGNTYERIIDAVKLGLIKEETVDKSAIKSLTTRALLGEFEKKMPYSDIGFENIDSDENKEINLEAARRSLILLKNDGILPLKNEKIKSIAMIGPNALSKDALIGNYYGHASEYVTCVDGIRKTLPDVRINYSEGCGIIDDFEGQFNLYNAKAAAKHSDFVILCVGLDNTIEGEELGNDNDYSDKGDKTTLALPKKQQTLIEEVIKSNKNTIIVSMSGSAIDVGVYAIKNARAIIQAFYPGAQGGNAIAELILGKFSPCGKLPVTFYSADTELPDFCDYSMENRTYRFFKGEPIYPFGFGLSYCDFKYTDFKLISETNDTIKVSVNLENQSEMDSREVTEVYAKITDSTLRTPNFQLCGIENDLLKAKSSKKIQLEINKKWLKCVDEEGNRVEPDGEITLFIGSNQPDKVSDKLTGKNCLSLKIR